MGTPAHVLPIRGVCLYPFAEPDLFTAGFGKNREKPAPLTDKVCPGFPNAQCGISPIKKIGTADELSKGLPALDMSLVIRGVPIAEPEMNGNRPVRTDGQNLQNLF